MTKPILADSRRTSESGDGSLPALQGGSPLDMPVLFQLADLSQVQVLTPPREAAAEEVPAISAESEAAPREESAASESPSAEEANAPADSSASAADKSDEAPATTPDEAVLAGAVESAVEEQPAAAIDSPTIRERAQLRQRRQQAAAGGDWFRTQGRYILIGFCFLLLATIYFARLKDDSPPSPAADDTAPELLAHDATHDDESPETSHEDAEAPAESQPNHMTDDQRVATASEPPPSAVAESSPADMVENPAPPAAATPPAEQVASSPQVSLQPPIVPVEQSPAAGPPTTVPTGDANLFPWSQEDQARVASRPRTTIPGSSVPLPVENPHFAASRSGQAAGTNPQAAAPQPSETSRSGPALQGPTGQTQEPVYPVTQQTFAAPTETIRYPVTDPSSFRSFAPSGPYRTKWEGAPASYQNRAVTSPRTSGPRYERSGSGLY